MKTKLLLFSIVFGMGANAQSLQGNANINCTTPPPPGYNNVYGLDTDNDGFALFDMQYYADYIDRPEMESYFGASSSGYVATFYAYGVVQPFLYTTTSSPFNQFCSLEYVYDGSGPEFSPQPPCYWPVDFYFVSRGLRLIAVPYNGDEDNDGILNADEDTNNNLNLMDDDDDNDGIINLKDNVNDLASAQHTIAAVNIYPNPITNGVLNFESNEAIDTITIYDATGKQLSDNKISSTVLNVATLTPGIYFLKFKSDKGIVHKKIIISK